MVAAIVATIASSGGVLIFRMALHQQAADFDQIVIGARLALSGATPYTLTPPSHLSWPIYYPLPALLFALPFVGLSLPWAHAIFFGLSAGLAAWVLSERGIAQLYAFATWPFMLSLSLGQWTPLLIAASGIPALGWVAVAKPNLGIALGAGYGPRWIERRSLWVNVLALSLLISASFVIRPSWVGEWLALVRAPHPHILVPLTVPGGALLLFAVVRWRRPEARFLAALACVPQTFSSYDSLLLFLAVRTSGEGIALALLMLVVTGVIGVVGVAPTYGETVHRLAWIRVCVVYLPTLAMVLRRPNQGAVPALLERAADRLPKFLRGRADYAGVSAPSA